MFFTFNGRDECKMRRTARNKRKVSKFSLKKYEFDTVKDLFLIAPTETKIIYNENQEPILVIEIQDYLDKK